LRPFTPGKSENARKRGDHFLGHETKKTLIRLKLNFFRFTKIQYFIYHAPNVGQFLKNSFI